MLVPRHLSAIPSLRLLCCAFAALCFVFLVNTARAEPRLVEISHADRTLLANLSEVGDKGKDTPLVLMIHGTFAHKDMELMTALQTALAERGVHSLAISLSYREDRRKGPRNCKLPIMDTYADSHKEIDAWIDWLSTQGFQKIVLLGHSRGGARVAEYLSMNDGKKVLNGAVLLAPSTEKPGRFEREYRGSFSTDEIASIKSQLVTARDDKMFDLPGFLYCPKTRASAGAIRSYYGEKQIRNTGAFLKTVSSTQVLVVAAGADTVVKDVPEVMSSLVNGKNIELEVIEDADHLFLDFYAEDAADLISEFTAKNGAN